MEIEINLPRLNVIPADPFAIACISYCSIKLKLAGPGTRRKRRTELVSNMFQQEMKWNIIPPGFLQVL